MNSGIAAAAVVAAGVAAAMHVGKLPPALPELRQHFGMTLVQASYLVSALQMASVTLGIVGGMLADRLGLRRVMLTGLALLACGSIASTFADSVPALLGLRLIESFGFMLAVLPGPGLLRRSLGAATSRWLGIWGSYMPSGMALGMIGTPLLLQSGGWRLPWWFAALLSLLVLAAVRHSVAADLPRLPAQAGVAQLIRMTVSAPGPWLLALAFGCYAAQWMSVFSFLPTIYSEAGIAMSLAGPLTALAVAVNIVGNVGGGLLAQRQAHPSAVISIAAVTMAAMAWVTFGSGAPFAWRFGAVVLLSIVSGMIPGTLFSTAPRLAPDAGAISTTVGLMQQGSSAGQVIAPPILAAIATASGNWQQSWIVTGLFAGGDLLAAALLVPVLARAQSSSSRRASSSRRRES